MTVSLTLLIVWLTYLSYSWMGWYAIAAAALLLIALED